MSPHAMRAVTISADNMLSEPVTAEFAIRCIRNERKWIIAWLEELGYIGLAQELEES